MVTDLSHLPSQIFDGLPRSVRRYHSRQSFGFFWLPCPICGDLFSGSDARTYDGHADSVPDADTPGLSHLICPNCTAEGRGCLAHNVICDGSAHPDYVVYKNGLRAT